jgi:NAD(P)-dependent dehydrogenase (short-subunit alcohol dehydrogenase family)
VPSIRCLARNGLIRRGRTPALLFAQGAGAADEVEELGPLAGGILALGALGDLQDRVEAERSDVWGASVHGLRASAFKAAYVSAKHGLEGLTKVIAVEAAPHGVTANCINPAYVRTPLVEGQIADQARTHGIPEAEVIEKIMLAKAAIKRLIEPAEVAELAAYLCTPAASFITGTSIAMDGGWTAQ